MNERNAPSALASRGVSESSAGRLNTPNSTPYPGQIRLSDAAENYISALATDLVTGKCEFSQLPPSLRELWIFAYEDGRRSRQHEIDNLNARADNLYLAAYSPKVRAEMIAARLDTHFEREAARLYEEWSR